MGYSTIIIAFAAGLIPALFWLWFWIREDKVHPEPKSLIISSFIAGMLVVPIVLPIEKFAVTRFDGTNLLLVWVLIEEVLKYSAALIVVLWNKAVDEPIDCIIYMITIALGFAALENTLFIANLLGSGDIIRTIFTGNFRFIGATLLHVLASGTIGVFMAFSFYKKTWIKVLYATTGLCIAFILHSLFNFFIIHTRGGGILTVFLFVWIGIIMLFLIFEKVKRIEKKSNKTL